MTLLIIDDEELTRTGIVETMNWPELGIGTVLQADDGIRGLEMARIHRPDIMLCDIRMPRMDGIEMLSQIESFLPDTIVIFMSGYSDKEYLKAAIRFQAVSYIEKPFLPSEMEDAIREAVRRSHQKTPGQGASLESTVLPSCGMPDGTVRKPERRNRPYCSGALPSSRGGQLVLRPSPPYGAPR